MANDEELTLLCPLPRVCAPSNATTSLQLKPILVKNNASTCWQPDAPGRCSPDPMHMNLSSLPHRNVSLRFNALSTEVMWMTAFADATQKSALEI